MRIAQILNGTNDVGALNPTMLPYSYNMKGNYSFSHLHLYRNDPLNHAPLPELSTITNDTHPALQVTKSFNEVFLSRAFVDFIFDELFLDGFRYELEKGATFAVDENFFGTLNANDVLRAPGGFTRACLAKSINVDSISR